MKRFVRFAWIALPALMLTAAALIAATAQDASSTAKPTAQTPGSASAQNAPATPAKTDPASTAKTPASTAKTDPATTAQPPASAAKTVPALILPPPASVEKADPAAASKTDKQLETFTLKHAPPSAVAVVLRIALGRAAPRFVVSDDGKSVLAYGNVEQYRRRIVDLIAFLDVPALKPDDATPRQAIYKPADRDPRAATPAPGEPGSWEGVRQLARYRLRHIAPMQAVNNLKRFMDTFNAEMMAPVFESNNSLVLFGQPERIREAVALMDRFDVPPADKTAPMTAKAAVEPSAPSAAPPSTASKGEPRLVAYALQQPMQDLTARILNVIFVGVEPAESDSPRIVADDKNQRIIVMGNEDEHREIKEILEILDVPALPPEDTGKGRPLPMASRAVPCRVVAPSKTDPRRAAVAWVTKHLAVYRLRRASAQDALTILLPLHAGRSGADPLRIEANPVNNSIILLGDGEKIRDAGEVLRVLDSMRPRDATAQSATTVRSKTTADAKPPAPNTAAVFTLKNIDTQLMEKVLDRVFRKTHGNDRPKITVDAKANSLTVADEAALLHGVGSLILFLDVPPRRAADTGADSGKRPRGLGPGGRFQFRGPEDVQDLSLRQMQHIPARTVLEALKHSLPGLPDDELWIEANPVNETIIAIGNPLALRTIADAIPRFDVPPGGAKVDPKAKPVPPEPEKTQLKVFRLIHIPAADALEMIGALYLSDLRDGGCKLAVDVHSNSLIARGPERLLREIEPLLLRLDSAESADRSAGVAAAGRVSTTRREGDAFVTTSEDAAAIDRRAAQAAQRYRALEQEAARLAEELRKAALGGPGGATDLAGPLRAKVAEAFDARQELQQLELSRLQRRLARIEGSLRARQRIKDAIVTHRVQELLNPNLPWTPSDAAPSDATAAQTRAGREDASSPQTRDRGGRQTEPSDARLGSRGEAAIRTSDAANPLRGSRDTAPSTARATAPASTGYRPFYTDPNIPSARQAADGVRLFNAPHVFQEKLAEAVYSLKQCEDLIRMNTDGLRIGNPSATIDDLKKQAPVLFHDLEKAKKAVEFLRAEYAAQVRLLELDMAQAMQQRDAAAKEYALIKDANQKSPGAFSVLDSDKAANAMRAAEVRVEQCKTLLELYRNVPDAQAEPAKREERTRVPPTTYGSSRFATSKGADNAAKPDGSDDAATEKLACELLGLTLRPVGREALAGSEYPGGLLVVDVRKDGPAEQQGVRVGDILVGLDQRATVSLDNVQWLLSGLVADYLATHKGPGAWAAPQLKFYVRRGTATMYGYLPISIPGDVEKLGAKERISKPEPAKMEPAKADPLKLEPAKAGPVKTESPAAKPAVR